MLDRWLLVTGGLAVVVAAISRPLDRVPLSEPLLALVAGILLGPQVLGVLSLPTGTETRALSLVAELTLAVALMAIALRYSISDVRSRVRPVAWLLLVVLPGMVVAGALVASPILGIAGGTALALGAALAPTDPVLASSVVSGEPAQRDLPDRLRQILSLESGANDGLALPFVVLAAAVATSGGVGGAVLSAVWATLGAIAIGGLLGWGTAAVLTLAEQHGDVDVSRALTFSLVLSYAALGLANVARTDGLLAVFVTGLAFNARTTRHERKSEHTIDQGVNRFLILPPFLLIGVALPWERWADLGWRAPLFAAAVLVLRRLPLVLMLSAVPARPLHVGGPGAVWLGWFGPIGGAAVFYLTHLDDLGVTEPLVWTAGSLVVATSTVVHGITAAPGRWWYARATASA